MPPCYTWFLNFGRIAYRGDSEVYQTMAGIKSPINNHAMNPSHYLPRGPSHLRDDRDLVAAQALLGCALSRASKETVKHQSNASVILDQIS